MKGFMTTCLTALCAMSGLTVFGGCDRYRNLVDPCYPDRYEYASRNEVIAAFTPQVHNGHFLDQTIWNYQFEPGTDRLTAGGMDHLLYLARRRPYPDCTLYLATAHDIPYDPAAPGKLPEQRANLDQRRIQAIQNYLGAETAGRHVNFEVVVHDPAEPSLAAVPVNTSVQKMYAGFQGALGPTAGIGAPGAVGGAPSAAAAPGGGGSPAAPPR